MKTRILTSLAILLFAATGTNAQITQGKYVLGGSLGYSNSQGEPNNSTPSQEAFNSYIEFGKAFKDNTIAGVILSYSHANITIINKANYYSGGVFYRKYKPLTKGLYFFGEADLVYSYSQNIQGKLQIGSEGTRYTQNEVRIIFVPGLSYAVCKWLQMELSMPNVVSLSYNRAKTESTFTSSQQTITSKSNNFNANANLNSNLLNNLGIGFKFLLGK